MKVESQAAGNAVFQPARSIFGPDDLLGSADEIGMERRKTRRVLTEGRFGQQGWARRTVLVAANDAALRGPDGCAVPAALT
ncbi:hypothetical protein [Actinophytocola gossypii]|uniref:Uncharacterized protein n=1 Tax=Actinophytocola gossypii TaxID=2812003 RepID=A0ABT2JGY2_9PSEU|nr:hypothetical protein [Actinophytocola gossypii]MCT2586998.1 hypothetical protein [Actinophytocola gossypii]